jgi:hypothetical protein
MDLHVRPPIVRERFFGDQARETARDGLDGRQRVVEFVPQDPEQTQLRQPRV